NPSDSTSSTNFTLSAWTQGANPTLTQPYVKDGSGNVFVLPAGVVDARLTGMSMGNLTLGTSGNNALMVPLAVLGNLSAGNLSGQGAGTVGVVASGDINLSGSVSNVSAGQAGNVAVLSQGNVVINGNVSTVS